MEITKTVIEEYELREEKPFTYCRVAKIQFKDGKFSHCDYKTDKGVYSRDDWKFLGKIEKKIEEISEKQNNRKEGYLVPGLGFMTQETIDEEKKALEKSGLSILAGQAQNDKKMTYDDVVWPPTLKCYPGMGIAVDKITPEGLQEALNKLNKDIMDLPLKQIHP